MTLSITFYNNVKYTKDDFINRDKDFFGNGVVNAGDFALTYASPASMTVNVGKGVAWVDGYRIANDASPIALTVPAASAQARIDIIQIGHDDFNSVPSLKVKQGIPGTTPLEPGPDSGFITLYAISVPAGTTSITSTNVTDRRKLVPLNVSGSQINFAGAATTTTNTYTGTQTAPSFVATSTTAPLQLPNLTALPAVAAAGTLVIVNNKWYQSTGTAWTPMVGTPASASALGSVKVGTGLAVAADGTISTTPSQVGAVNKAGDTMTGALTAPSVTLTAASGTAPLTVTSQTAVTNLNADLHDGYHAGNASGQIPISNGTLNTNLNADLLDGLHASNATGQVPVSNGTVNVNLNADMVDGYHAGNATGQIPLSNGTVNANLNADMLDGYHAGNASGQVPVSNGTVNANLNADLHDGYHAGNASGQVPVSNGTVNANLNADLLDGLHADGIVGQRFQNSAPAADQYYLVATLPATSSSTLDKLILEVQGGPSYLSDGLINDWMLFGNRGSFAYQYMRQGVDTSNSRANFRVVAYSQTDGTVKVYLKALANQYTVAVVSAYGVYLGNTTTAIQIGAATTTAPTGTLVFDSYSTTPNANLSGGTITASSLQASSTTAPLQLPNLATLPAVGPAGTICVVSNTWYQSSGTAWIPMTPPATATSIGGIKIGAGINVAADGTIDINSTVLDPFRTSQLNFLNLALEVETMKKAQLNGVTANIFVESFVDTNDITLLHGSFDATNQKVYLP